MWPNSISRFILNQYVDPLFKIVVVQLHIDDAAAATGESCPRTLGRDQSQTNNFMVRRRYSTTAPNPGSNEQSWLTLL